MKALEQLSIKGLHRRRNHLMTMPISTERVVPINKIDALIQAKLTSEQIKPKRGRPRIHKKYQSGIAIRQPQR